MSLPALDTEQDLYSSAVDAFVDARDLGIISADTAASLQEIIDTTAAALNAIDSTGTKTARLDVERAALLAAIDVEVADDVDTAHQWAMIRWNAVNSARKALQNAGVLAGDPNGPLADATALAKSTQDAIVAARFAGTFDADAEGIWTDAEADMVDLLRTAATRAPR